MRAQARRCGRSPNPVIIQGFSSCDWRLCGYTCRAAGQAAPAAPTAFTGTAAAAHKCLVATGSGDPAFVRNFNPYVQGLPSSSFVRGGMYEPLVIVTPAGGGKEYKWLAQSYAWSKDGKTIVLTMDAVW